MRYQFHARQIGCSRLIFLYFLTLFGGERERERPFERGFHSHSVLVLHTQVQEAVSSPDPSVQHHAVCLLYMIKKVIPKPNLRCFSSFRCFYAQHLYPSYHIKNVQLGIPYPHVTSLLNYAFSCPLHFFSLTRNLPPPEASCRRPPRPLASLKFNNSLPFI
jgi:hypothetical protein